MKEQTPVFDAAEALLYLCVSRCGLERLSRILVGITLVAGLIGGAVLLLGG